MRYVFRILAAKIILENPSAYGYCLPTEALYQPLPSDRVRLNLTSNLHLRTLGQATGSNVRMLKELNPELLIYMVPKGMHDLKVPKGQGAGLAQRLANIKLDPTPPCPSPSSRNPCPWRRPRLRRRRPCLAWLSGTAKTSWPRARPRSSASGRSRVGSRYRL